ncbi:hypothetical protein BH24GEM3_BH24GEM3_02070 [soil metagenome]
MALYRVRAETACGVGEWAEITAAPTNPTRAGAVTDSYPVSARSGMGVAHRWLPPLVPLTAAAGPMAAAGLMAAGLPELLADPAPAGLAMTLQAPRTPQLAAAEGEADTFPADVRGITVRNTGGAAWVARTRAELGTNRARYVGRSSVASMPWSGRQVWLLNAEPGGVPVLIITATAAGLAA